MHHRGAERCAVPVFIDNVATFVVLVCLGTCTSRATAGVRNGMIARTIEVPGRVAARADRRAATSTGTAVGAALGVLPLALPSRQSMSIVIELDAMTFLVAAVIALN